MAPINNDDLRIYKSKMCKLVYHNYFLMMVKFNVFITLDQQ